MPHHRHPHGNGDPHDHEVEELELVGWLWPHPPQTSPSRLQHWESSQLLGVIITIISLIQQFLANHHKSHLHHLWHKPFMTMTNTKLFRIHQHRNRDHNGLALNVIWTSVVVLCSICFLQMLSCRLKLVPNAKFYFPADLSASRLLFCLHFVLKTESGNKEKYLKIDSSSYSRGVFQIWFPTYSHKNLVEICLYVHSFWFVQWVIPSYQKWFLRPAFFWCQDLCLIYWIVRQEKAAFNIYPALDGALGEILKQGGVVGCILQQEQLTKLGR